MELTLHNIAEEMQRRGHQIHIVAPTGSVDAALTIIEIAGELQITAQTQSRHDPITMPANAVLANMWEYARQIQERYDILVNFAYDWLPFYLTPFFQRPIAHLVSMGSLSDAMDQIIQQVADQFPGTIGVHSQAQANTFPFAQQCRCLENGLDLSLYHFEANPDHRLAWVGRIAPEKGLEDAIAAVQKAQIPLSIWGTIQDEAYWNTLQRTYPDAPIRYEGFLPTAQLQQALGKCQGLLMTPKWVEAFGNVAIEALACGVPVIAYHRGGPAEIVQQGKTGWLVEPDQIDGLVDAIAYLDKIDRHACRQQAETRYSMSAMGDRVEAWLSGVLGVG